MYCFFGCFLPPPPRYAHMTAVNVNIRVYRTTLVDIHFPFVEAETNGGEETSHQSICDLAQSAHWSVERLQRRNGPAAKIDFADPPTSHTELSEDEQVEFWEHYHKIT
jgi:hypothetical protein